MAETAAIPRVVLLRRAVVLTALTLSWRVVEGVVAITAAPAAGSVAALLGFGVDSSVEGASVRLSRAV